MPSLRVIGGGRAGCSMAMALQKSGWDLRGILGRDTPPAELASAASDVDLALIATPDSVVVNVSTAVLAGDAVVAHLAGSLGLNVVSTHQRRGALHPLVAMPDAETGARRLISGCWFAVAGDPLVRRVVDDLGGKSFEVADADRAAYHAAAVVASNHLVALLAQAERIAASASVPFNAFMDLVRATVENVAELGPKAALTGPAARGDMKTIARHLAAVGKDERHLYEVLSHQALRLAGRDQSR